MYSSNDISKCKVKHSREELVDLLAQLVLIMDKRWSEMEISTDIE